MQSFIVTHSVFFSVSHRKTRGSGNMLDINLLRAEKGGNPDLVKESQRRRYKDVTLVDQVCFLLCHCAFQFPSAQNFLSEAASFLRTKIVVVVDLGDDTEPFHSKRSRLKCENALLSGTRVCLQVIEVDVAWRQSQFKVENLRADYGKVNKEVAMKKKAGENADDLIAKAKEIDTEIKVRSSRGRERGRGREGEGGHCYRANIIAFKN
jgi:hypothetical protein